MDIERTLTNYAVLIAISISVLAFGQDRLPLKREIKLTGVVLSWDHPCSEKNAQPNVYCRSSDWALASGRTTYLLYGDKAALQRFGRKRVNVTGVLEEEPIVEYGMQMIRRKIAIQSIERSELGKDSIEALVNQLKVVPWRGPENTCRPMCWAFNFTDPMIQLLQAGIGAQETLLEHINDQEIQDQVVMLLGGVGDEKAIWPIVETLPDGSEASLDARSKRMNLIGNLALTNLTVSEVIWHHGGGIPIDHCPSTPKSCWSKWWLEQKETFKVGMGGDRLYTNYPNYGIYEQFADLSSR